MGERDVNVRAVAPPTEGTGQKQHAEVAERGYQVPSPRDVARASGHGDAAAVAVAEFDDEFDEDSFLNEELEGDETRIANSHIEVKKTLPAQVECDDFLGNEDETRLSQTGVRRSLRPRDGIAADFDDFGVDDFEEETRLADRDVFSGPTNRPQPLEKKTG